MAANRGAEVFSQKAEGIWKMLDDLSESDPEGYKKFLEKTFQEQRELSEPPQPRFCICSTVMPEIIQHKFFINICSWNQIPPPKTEMDPIPVMAGEVKDMTENSREYSVVDTVFNPVILDKVAENSNDRRLLVQLAIEYIQSTKNITLSQNYKEMKIQYKGDVQNLKGFVKKTVRKVPQEQVSMADTQQTLLQQLSSIASTENDTPVDSPLKFIDKKNEKCKVNLIEEVSSAPTYTLTLEDADDNQPARVQVLVQLPDVESIQQQDVNLKVSKVDMMLHAANMEDLQVLFPREVDDSRSKAVFNKKKHKLTITVPVLQQ